jgi:xanthine dehydrogenase YagS FAD-binding subunit
MQSFEWIDATSVEHAASLMNQDNVVAKAGGIDLLDLMKEGIVTPARLVNLSLLEELRGIGAPPKEGLRLGALTTLAEIAAHPAIKEQYGALAQSAAHAATPQVRNVATIGGNLLQRPRCWYFRNQQFHRAASAPSDQTDLQQREHQYHAIFANSTTAMVHASTPATALIAYGASVHLRNAGGRTRAVPLIEFLLPPAMTRDRDATIARDEILTHVTVPPTPQATRSAYHKQTERESYDWPIFDIAVVLSMQGAVIESASIVLGGAAPTPMRVPASEAAIKGKRMTESLANEAAALAVRGATPFKSNAYKVPMLEAVLRRTLLAAGA